jgi:2'-5' RNA ligase
MNTSGELVRLFFAALPEPGVLARLAGAADALRLGPPARLVCRENLHMTCAFIGEIPVARLADAMEIGRRQRGARFSLRFNAYEYWPKPEVVVAAARTIPAPLQALWETLHRELAVHGWALDPKPLRPHVTLARKVSQPPVLQAMSPLVWDVSGFSLMRSDTGGAQSAYTVVGSWPLLDDAAET